MKFKEKMTCSFKYDMRNFVNFHPTTQKFQNFTSMDYFCPKYEVRAKQYGGVIFHDTEQRCKIWINPDLVVSKMAWWIGWTFIIALENLKNCTLMGSFCPKVMFQLENFRGIMCHDTEGYIMQNLKENRLVVWKMT